MWPIHLVGFNGEFPQLLAYPETQGTWAWPPWIIRKCLSGGPKAEQGVMNRKETEKMSIGEPQAVILKP